MAYILYLCSINARIVAALKKEKVKKFVVSEPAIKYGEAGIHILSSTHGDIKWSTSKDRINIIRKGIPYGVIEKVCVNIGITTGRMLNLLGIVQRTYNKKKKEDAILDPRFSEALLELQEIYDFGIEVFNNEKEKFLRWLKKPNPSLGDVTPESLFDSITGITEVRKALTRMEYGNMA